jgi:hypothetical protein
MLTSLFRVHSLKYIIELILSFIINKSQYITLASSFEVLSENFIATLDEVKRHNWQTAKINLQKHLLLRHTGKYYSGKILCLTQ